ncbi:MAG: DUF2339 domain-containing protein [Dehalococcoidia bacterium]
MQCPECGRENHDSNAFCVNCGVPLAVSTDAAANDEGETASQALAIEALQRQVAALHRDIASLRAALAQHDIGVPAQSAVPPPAAPARAQSRPTATVPSEEEPEAPQPQRAGVADRFMADPELILGGNWLVRIGVVAIIIGAGFFLQLAIEQGWLAEGVRIGLGVALGGLLLAGGERWRRRYQLYAQALSGGGIGVLYLTVFAAASLYGMIDFYPALGVFVLLSAAAAGLALRYDSASLATIGVLGALLAPFALGAFTEDTGPAGTDEPQLQLLWYIFAVDLAVLGLAVVRTWRWLTLVGLLGSLAGITTWVGIASEYDPLAAQAAVTAVFLVFAAATMLFHVAWRRSAEPADYLLMAINAGGYFLVSFALLEENYEDWLAPLALTLAVLHGVIAAAAWRRAPESRALGVMAIGIAAFFAVIAVPLQFEGPVVSVAWAAEAVVLAWLSFRLGMFELRIYSLLAFAILGLRLLFVESDAGLADDSFVPVLNARAAAFLSAIAALYAAAYMFARDRLALRPREADTTLPGMLIAANVVTLWWLSIEVVRTYESGFVDVGATEISAQLLTLTLVWGAYAGAMLAVGVARRWRMVRVGALALLGVTLLKLFLVDTFQLELGYRVAAYLCLGALLVVGGYLYQRYAEALRGFLMEDSEGQSQGSEAPGPVAP